MAELDIKKAEKLEEKYDSGLQTRAIGPYLVKFTYVTKRKPDAFLYFSFPQFDSEPYFPRINRFYEFCIKNMKKFNFIDYEIIEYHNQIPRYQENIDKEFTIH